MTLSSSLGIRHTRHRLKKSCRIMRGSMKRAPGKGGRGMLLSLIEASLVSLEIEKRRRRRIVISNFIDFWKVNREITSKRR